MGVLARGAFITVVFAVGMTLFSRLQQPSAPKAAAFEELRPGVFRHLLDVSPLPQLFELPVASWLLRAADQHSWILVDTGVGQAFQNSLKAALKTTLSSPQDKLKLILLTHGHNDHTQGLAWLLEAYPHAHVAFHKKEARFITGKGKYAELDGEHWSWSLMKHVLSANSSQPVERCTTLQETQGDVSSALSAAIPDVSSWLPPDFLEYVLTPGHAPGHVAFVHKPTSSLLAGDVLVHAPPLFAMCQKKVVGLQHPPFFLSPQMSVVKESQRQLAARSDIETIFPSHDHAAGVNIRDLRAWIQRGYTA
ncbi:hypothetical protein WJX74_001065 [Apatococcus lobatus]|uniref:Metallo-beta-lactamase domain-containing protein n=1 Tax=Apatococcus lobatus TaxID=904363 RepID=A0AAW1Q5U5_9CHLO